jgi:hypothetical protein
MVGEEKATGRAAAAAARMLRIECRPSGSVDQPSRCAIPHRSHGHCLHAVGNTKPQGSTQARGRVGRSAADRHLGKQLSACAPAVVLDFIVKRDRYVFLNIIL